MHEVNGFAILNESETALVIGPGGEREGKILRIAPPSLSRRGLEELCREAASLPGRARSIAGTSDPGALLTERLERALAAQQARSDSAVCRATALALRDPQWRSNRAVLAELACATDRMGRPCAAVGKTEGGSGDTLQGDGIASFEEFVTSVHRSLSGERRRVLANLYEELASAHQSRCNAHLRFEGALSGAEAAMRRPNPWLAKGYYRPMRDGRDRVLADAQGRIFFEYVNPATPTRWARKAVKAAAIAWGSDAGEADLLASRFHFLDVVTGELRAGMENTASHFSNILASKKVTDPYARALAVVFWSVKDFLESRSGDYPEVVRSTAIREAAAKAAAYVDLPQERAVIEEALARADRGAEAQERRIEAILLRNGWTRAEGGRERRGPLPRESGRER